MSKLFSTLSLIFYVVLASSQSNTNHYSYKDLIDNLEKIALHNLEPSDVIKSEYHDFVKKHNIKVSDETYKEYVRVRLVFELTRDSGLWQIRWKVTNNEPTSEFIWKQWASLTTVNYENERTAFPTAVAECDELSALFAFIARDLGVSKVGLFWPTWNHTVAVWTSIDKHGKPVRIVVPTTQILLGPNETLGTNGLNPNTQKTIYPYDHNDINKDYQIPKELFEMMLSQAMKYGARTNSELQERRNILSRKFGGSTSWFN
jgi:hypothetical protein